MKKSLLAIGLISSFAFAEFDTKVLVGASSAKIDKENYTQYNLGYTANTRFDNGIILGFGDTLSYGNVKNGIQAITLDLDLRAGHEIINNLTGYVIGTGAIQSVDNNASNGLGYGVSLEYRITSNVLAEVSYKTINMNDSDKDYDYKTTNFGVKFNY